MSSICAREPAGLSGDVWTWAVSSPMCTPRTVGLGAFRVGKCPVTTTSIVVGSVLCCSITTMACPFIAYCFYN